MKREKRLNKPDKGGKVIKKEKKEEWQWGKGAKTNNRQSVSQVRATNNKQTGVEREIRKVRRSLIKGLSVINNNGRSEGSRGA